MQLTPHFSYTMLNFISDKSGHKKLNLTPYHTFAIHKPKLKDGYKGKQISMHIKEIVRKFDLEKNFHELSNILEIDLEELYNVTNHLKWWKIGTYVYCLDNSSYFR